MNKHEENWELYTLVGIPWKDANELEDGDRAFLLNKADDIKKGIMEQRAREENMRTRMQAEARQNVPNGPAEAVSNAPVEVVQGG